MNRLILLFYNLFFPPLLLLLLPGYLLRIRKRGGYGHKAWQRFGIIDRETFARIGTGRIWIHAVSVGEVGIAIKFATEHRRLHPEARFLISSTTSTGLVILERSASEWLEPIANPVDFPIITGRLVKRFLPSALLFVEADLWPNRIRAAKKLGIPTALINARLSPRSERRFHLAGPFAAAWFNQLDLITLSDTVDRDRFLGLGVNPSILCITGNIKHDIAPSERTETAREDILLAASTHAGEEEILAEAWKALRNDFPSLRLVIAPRHAERRNEIREALTCLGISCTLRSEGGVLADNPLILDTTGELSSWYPRAAVAFVGKSLSKAVNHGGQNMIEPLQSGTPVLIGPHTANFEPLASELVEAGAAIRADQSAEIVTSIRSLLGNEAQRAAMIGAATTVLRPHQGAAQRTSDLIQGMMG
jgi:3-deoxy-D-manno-octulosonic-acid transferase